MKRVLAISLLIIFISGQVNLTWADHFCMSFKVKSSMMLGHGHLDCGMGEMMDCDEEENQSTGLLFKTPECCSNDFYSSDSDDHFERPISDNTSQLLFLASFVESYLSLFPENTGHVVQITPSPPLIQSDRQVMYQTFLL